MTAPKSDPATTSPTRFAVCVRRYRNDPWKTLVHAGDRAVAERLMMRLVGTLRKPGARSLDFAVLPKPADELDPRAGVSYQESQEPRSAMQAGNQSGDPEQCGSDAKEDHP